MNRKRQDKQKLRLHGEWTHDVIAEIAAVQYIG